MKKLTVLALCLFLIVTTSLAQVAKPRLFARYPDKINVSETILSNAFTSAKGQSITVAFDDLIVSGTVISNEFKYSNLQSITILAPSFNNAFLSISKITNADKSVTYAGRILNPKAADGYEIKKNAGGSYQLVKFEMSRILQDCSYN